MNFNAEVDKLTNILRNKSKTYNQNEIRTAIMAEGYSNDIAKAVIDKLYNNTKNEVLEKKEEEIKDIPKKDYFEEVNSLLEELKKIHNVEELKINHIQNENLDTKILDSDEISVLKRELESIIINKNDDNIIITKDNKQINLNDIPRREWRTYRDNGKSIAEIKELKKQELRKKIYQLKQIQNQDSKENPKEIDMSEEIFKQVSNTEKKEIRRPEDNYKEQIQEKQKIEDAAENIYKQLQTNPEKEEDSEIEKKKDKKDEKKKDNLNLDLDLDSGSNQNETTDDDFELNLDLK